MLKEYALPIVLIILALILCYIIGLFIYEFLKVSKKVREIRDNKESIPNKLASRQNLTKEEMDRLHNHKTGCCDDQ